MTAPRPIVGDGQGTPGTPPFDVPGVDGHIPSQIGAYRILEQLGHGGMGLVFKAEHLHLNRIVALKILPAVSANQERLLLRFQREARAVGQLDHPHIVRATDAGEASGFHFLVMEYLEGIDLHHLVARLGPLAIPEACELLRQAALGLHELNVRGYVHRDIKPANLFLTRQGRVKLLDFGLVRLYAVSAEHEELTASGQIMGTADYMAPEQGQDARHADIRADLYSLGCTAYRLLAGRPPFWGPPFDTFARKVLAHAQEPAPPLTSLRPDTPAGLAAVVHRLLAKSPIDRFAVPADLIAALTPFAQGADVARLLQGSEEARGPSESERLTTPDHQTRPEAAPGPSPQPGRRRAARRWSLLAAAVVCLAAVGVAVFSRWRPDREPSDPGDPRTDTAGTGLQAPAPAAPRIDEWFNLLRDRPKAIVWPRHSLEANWRLEGAKEHLWVTTDQEALLALGEVSDRDYLLQVGITQSRWEGGVGVFFGFQEKEAEGKTQCRYQLIDLRHDGRAGLARSYRLNRSLQTCLRGREGFANGESYAAAPIPYPESTEQILELTIRHGRLDAARWAGKPLPELVNQKANGRFTAGDYDGRFGVYAQNSTALFRNCRLMLLERSR